jgi:hypothetical protein
VALGPEGLPGDDAVQGLADRVGAMLLLEQRAELLDPQATRQAVGA